MMEQIWDVETCLNKYRAGYYETNHASKMLNGAVCYQMAHDTDFYIVFL